MQAISLRPQQRVIVQKRVALYALVVLMAVAPVLCLPLTMVMTLFICPLMKGNKRWLVLVALPLPAVIALLHGYSPLLALGLLGLTALPALAAWLLKTKDLAASKGFLVFLMAIACPLLVALLSFCVGEGGEPLALSAALADRAEQWVMSHPQRAQLIYQAMSSGLLPVPEDYDKVTLLQLTLDPIFLGEVRLILHSRALHLVETTLPSLFIQSCLLLSFFICLRIQRMWGAFLLMNKSEPHRVSVALAPSFSTFRLSGRDHWLMLLFLLFYLFFATSGGVMQRLSQLMYHTFETAYQLQGGAVICSLIMSKDQERRILAGILAAVLYLFMPMLLFVVGCFSNVFSFRSHTEDDKKERENNEEEEQ